MEPLNGHEAGNGGHSQGASCTPPRRSPTRLHSTQRWHLAGGRAVNVGKDEEERKPFARSALRREDGLRLLVAGEEVI
jgi:hypothetical protein